VQFHGRAPTKPLVLASRIRDEIADGAGLGWTIVQASFDWPTMIAKEKEIAVNFIHAQWWKRPS
jgi:pyruvate/2-oxoglutarate dehydrogenase complex dihydrolipoamide dehydrogenase (E3) component